MLYSGRDGTERDGTLLPEKKTNTQNTPLYTQYQVAGTTYCCEISIISADDVKFINTDIQQKKQTDRDIASISPETILCCVNRDATHAASRSRACGVAFESQSEG